MRLIIFFLLNYAFAFELTILSIGSRRFGKEDQGKKDVLGQCKNENIACQFFNAVDDFLPDQGMWAVFPAFHRIHVSANTTSWLLIVEESSRINIRKIVEFCKQETPDMDLIYGYELRDTEPTIIHHFGFDVPPDFGYPLFAAGTLLSPSIFRRIMAELHNFKLPAFSIDSKYEFAQLVRRHFDSARVLHRPAHFCVDPSDTCLVVWQDEPKHQSRLSDSDILVMIKTFHGNHETRLPVLKSTWTRQISEIVEYCSDVEDERHGTVAMGVDNTERGHCGKTWAILKRFMTRNATWLFVADDDTLVAWNRLKGMIGRFDPNEKMIIGERYGYGFQVEGGSGYDYPTGGAGMVFTRSAIESILKVCPNCPALDDPDDMILGMCALIANVAIVHEPRMHQARPQDYHPSYLRNPISFHKFTDIDPIEVYKKYLDDEEYSKNEL